MEWVITNLFIRESISDTELTNLNFQIVQRIGWKSTFPIIV